jgi:U4/U6 small nuclear ribonucleoprotein PRP4
MAAVPTTSLGNSNVGAQVEVVELTAASQRGREQHELAMLDMEAKNRAFSIDVPTLPNDVRQALRAMGQPVRLFGENLANVRDRLRMAMARKLVMEERGIHQPEGGMVGGQWQKGDQQQGSAPVEDEEEQITKYSRASTELIRAREVFSVYSLERARDRLNQEREYRVQWQRKRARLTSLHQPKDGRKEEGDSNGDDNSDYIDVTRIDNECLKLYKTIKRMGAEGSQYGDPRPLSCMATSNNSGVLGTPIVATGSWSGTIKLWDASLNRVSEVTLAHEDRIMGIALHPYNNNNEENTISDVMMATSSIDLTAKLWKIRKTNQTTKSDEMEDDEDNADTPESPYQIQEIAHLKGHASRLCKVAFHPQGNHVVTTSFDHTWRMWDIETGGEILLQDGHSKEVYGVGFHPDGSLCSTTDFGGVVHLWDLRTGKSVHHFLGHAKRVLCSEFSPNGFQLATAGDDGTLKIWDLRKRRQFASLPAHSKLVTQLRFEQQTGGSGGDSGGGVGGGEYLVSSSFDATAKVWSTRDWKMLATLRGHEGKVMGTGILKDSIVTCGFDKTLKLWK